MGGGGGSGRPGLSPSTRSHTLSKGRRRFSQSRLKLLFMEHHRFILCAYLQSGEKYAIIILSCHSEQSEESP